MIVYDVVLVPWATSCVLPVRESAGNVSSSDHSNRYRTFVTVPVIAAFVTASVAPLSVRT